MPRSVGHRVKTHKVTPAAGNERGDVEIKDYVILTRGEDNRLPPRTLIMEVTMTHDRYGRNTAHQRHTHTQNDLQWRSLLRLVVL